MARANYSHRAHTAALGRLAGMAALAGATLYLFSASGHSAKTPVTVGAAHAAPLDLLTLHALLLGGVAALLFIRLVWLKICQSLRPRRVTALISILASVAPLFLTACAGSPLEPLIDTPPTTPPAGHPASEGLPLGQAGAPETVYPGALCPPAVRVRQYDVVAIQLEITLNRYLDYDPQGRMYVLAENLSRARQEEAQNREARAGKGEPAVSLGLQGDIIQPLVLRVNQGECLRLTLRNELKDGEFASLHLHGSSLHLRPSGAPAIATNPQAMARPGTTVQYEWMVSDDEPEGTHYFHSHGDARLQTNHGLFGAVVVEPKGSAYVDPRTGGEARSGWDAIIRPPTGSAFREFAIFYHEIGNERYRHLDRSGRRVAQVDPLTDAYRPGDRALNYRSEPFLNRLALQQQVFGRFDKSMAYSSYVFGDPATPLLRSYLGDPVKQRVVHGGSEVFHVHHVHGGSIRWRRQPGAEPSHFDRGLDKHPPLLPRASERVDSQAIGPSEKYDVEHECGSGGCQQGAGDYLIHCHVAHHYFSGMWTIWRVYNTRQDRSLTQDGMPPLQELPDRLGQMQTAVPSDGLLGKTVDWKGKTFAITPGNLAEWVERQLPPPGVPRGYDASVMDWRREGDVYLNEPETDRSWPGFTSAVPGKRLPLYFDPKTGKPAYPFLRPHFGKRPPFAPNHGPAPFLDPIHPGADLPQPGENGPWSLCPAGTKPKQFSIHAKALPIPLNRRANIVDPAGTLYLLGEQRESAQADDRLRIPLAIRANAGEDCVDVVLKNELPDARANAFFSKVNLHIHFVQFDVQASDGVNTGFNYEQSVRPFTAEGETLTSDASAGAFRVQLSSTARFQAGTLVGVGMEQDSRFEVKRIKQVDGDTLVFDEPLRHEHASGESVSSEFVRYRWYPDVQFGTAYFHDHVDAVHSWRHGLFGALIAEPPGSTYRDPRTGAELRSGAVADIHTDAVVSPDIASSFRELVLFIQDDNPLTGIGNSSGSSVNLRVEPLSARPGDPSLWFSSVAHGDPATPLLESFLGDPIVVRALVGGTNDVHTWHIDGHWFRAEPYSRTSPPINTVHLGISERFDLMLPRAGGPQSMPGDYLYYSGRQFKLREGSWGIFRVFDGAANVALQRLPGRLTPAAAPASVCPAGAPLKEFAMVAVEVPLPMLEGSRGKIYVLQEQKEAVISGSAGREPLVLHVNVGDCIKVTLKNETTGGAVSLHADMLAYDPKDSYGVATGSNSSQAVRPGAARLYTFYAHPEFGETVALLRDWGNVVENPRAGLYGAIVVGPRGAAYRHPLTGEDLSSRASWNVNVYPSAADPPYRDFTLFMQDEDEIIGTAIMPYAEQVQGAVGLNYQIEPFAKRLVGGKNASTVFRRDLHGDPATPVLQAFAGDPMKMHVLLPFSEQAHVFNVEGHQWPVEPGLAGANMISAAPIGGLQALSIRLTAGGRAGLPGDYLYGDHREPFREAGLWGLLRVHRRGAAGVRLLPLFAR